jgi:cell wall-associated NlpC family hydrolase
VARELIKGAVAVGSAAIAAIVLGLTVLAGAATGTSVVTVAAVAMEQGSTCTVSGPVPGLDTAQADNADAIVTATFAVAAESQRAAQIALMTALTESGLHNYGPEVGAGGSVGLFQQIAADGWGTVSQEEDPTDATQMFVRRLLAVSDWSTMPPWAAAQAVQRSGAGAASDGAANYKPHWAPAGVYLAAILGNGNTSGSCGQGIPAGVSGVDHGLPTGYTIPAGTGPAHAQAVTYALAQLGKPYVWGAAGPSSYDCSGLTMAAWATVGIPLLHYTGDQQTEGAAVTAATLEPGDLILVPGSDSPAPGIAGHVGLYLGFGLVLSAIDPQLGVAVQSWQTFVSGGLTALRDPDPSDG